MKISTNQALSFKMKPKNEADFSDTLTRGKKLAGNKGKSILIVPASSLPSQTGVGNLGTDESLKFFDFAKKYWGVNEIQILPVGQYHSHSGQYPIYSGTTMDLGNHVIDIKSYVTDSEFQEIVKANNIKDRVNFKNVVEFDSVSEKILKKLYNRMDSSRKQEFEAFKQKNNSWLEPKGLYRALREINGTHDYKRWQEIDKNLFEHPDKDKRIAEIYKQKGETIDFYKFKQFLADDSLKKAKEKLNSKDLKLNGDLPCGFSYDEVWAHPKAFIKDAQIGWGLPALDYDNPEAEKLLREKVRLYAQRFDGMRVDASWTYASQPVIKPDSKTKKELGARILNIIDDEVKKVKGSSYDLKNIMHEFVTSPDDFNIYEGSSLKPFVKDRVKIYTSDYLSNDWGSNRNFLERGWNKESFIIGATNHDSRRINFSEKQAEALAKILRIPKEKLMDAKEFMKAKLAEPVSAYNNMIFFMEALGLKGEYLRNTDKTLNYTPKIPLEFEEEYFKAVERGEAFNPMDALEKSFKAQGLDKQNPKLFKKIVKYRKILEGNAGSNSSKTKIGIGIGLVLAGISALAVLNKKKAEKTPACAQ